MQAINDDVVFMRTVAFLVDPFAMLRLLTRPEPRIMRRYRAVTFVCFENFGSLSVLGFELLENVENLSFSDCKFPNTNEFVWVLKHCKRLKSLNAESSMFQDVVSETWEKFPNPVTLRIESPRCKALNCFEKILHLSIRSWVGLGVQDLAPFLSKHAVALAEISIFKGDSAVLQLLVDTPKLKLEQFKAYDYKPEQATLMAQFLANQRSTLTELSVEVAMVQPIYNVIRLHLVNLEELILTVSSESNNFCLSDLKVLSRLRSLRVNFDLFENNYEIDVGEFLNLEQLTLNVCYDDEFEMLVFKRPNLTLKQLGLNGLLLNARSLGQIPTMFPNLTSLELHSYVSSVYI
jgi:hypothetical protein